MLETILSGVLVFVASQYIMYFVLFPYRDYLQTVTKIDNKLKFYAQLIVNPPIFCEQIPDQHVLASKELRELSCELESRFRLTHLGWCEMTKKNVSLATRSLILLSNMIVKQDRNPLVADRHMNDVRNWLSIV